MEYRIEHDSMGEVKVPADKYWAAQTRIWYFEEGSSNGKPFAEAGKNDR